ncbi:ABC transporter ATP-binding protein [Nonomuraea salmonea]
MAEEPRAPIGRIIKLFGAYRGRLTVVASLIVLSSLVGLASPFLLREVLDVAIPARDAGLLTLLALGMILVAVTTTVFDVLQTLVSTTVGQRVMHDLRVSVYSHLQRMSMAFFTRTRTGEVQSRIANDIGGMQAVVTSTAASLVSNLTTVIATVVAMAALDWRLTLVSLALLPVFVWISRKVGSERKRITSERQRKLAGIASMVQESLSISGILLGRTMGRSAELTERFGRASHELAELGVATSMAGRWRQASIQLVMAAMPAAIYWAAGHTAAISVGTLVAFTTLQTSLFRPMVSLLRLGVEVQTSLALFGRIFEYLDLPVDIRPGTRELTDVRGEVRFEQVDFSYGDTPHAHRRRPHRARGLVAGHRGRDGLGQDHAQLPAPPPVRRHRRPGHHRRRGRAGADVRDAQRHRGGVVSQETYLFHASIADNLRFARPSATDEELEAAARAARIHDHIAALPDGYDTVVGERGYRFSGGEKQRLAIARTLLRDPPVLVLDEATSALDTQTEKAVQEALDTLARGRTTITIAHRLSTVRDAGQIVVLAHGRVVERGTHDELIARGGHYAALVSRDHPVELV